MNLIPLIFLAMTTVAGALIAGHPGAGIGFLVGGAIVIAATASNHPPLR